MKWEKGRRSSNVEDRRRRGGAGLAIGGGGAVVLALIMLIMGKDPMDVLQSVLDGSAGSEGAARVEPSIEEDRLADMCSVVLADTEDAWRAIFRKMGRSYVDPKLVIFSGYVESACGTADSSVGPFYCSGDEKVYLDLSFYSELSRRYGAPGDFAQAYVIAHEVGHHVQNLLGTLDKVNAKMAASGKAKANELSVKLELQADFYAGIWAHYANESRGLLESGDLEEALNAASAIGDDNLQKRAQGYAVPETFTHGTSAQRYKYFKKGYDTGDIGAFDLL